MLAGVVAVFVSLSVVEVGVVSLGVLLLWDCVVGVWSGVVWLGENVWVEDEVFG